MKKTIQQGSDYTLALTFKDINNDPVNLTGKVWELIIFNSCGKGYILRVKCENGKFENLGDVEAECEIISDTKLKLYINGSSRDFAKGELSAYTIYHNLSDSFKDDIQSIKSKKINLDIWVI